MKMKNQSWIPSFIVISIFCLITSSCKKTCEEEINFKSISLGPLTDDIPFEELGSGKILFQRVNYSDTTGFYIIDVDKKNSYGFTSNKYMQYLSVSPDGSKIACKIRYSDHDFIYGICCLNIDGTNCIPVTHSGGGDYPTWTPDGFRILYYLNAYDGPLYMISATENSTDNTEMIKFNYEDDPDWFIIPSGGFSMSPGGQLICVSRGGSKTGGILKIEPNIGKSGVNVLLPNTYEEPLVAVFSPDGTKIAFAILERDSLGYQQAILIKSMDPDGTNHTPLVRVKISNEAIIYSYHGNILVSLCWSPDGKKILISIPADQHDVYHLMALNADGSGLIQVTDEMNASDYHVSWGR